jgi:hypothetical protein
MEGRTSITIGNLTAWLCLALSCLAAGSAHAAKGKKALPVPSLQQTFAPGKLKEDVKVLRQALEGGHPGLYLYTPKEEFDLHFEQVEKAFDRPLTLREFYLEVAPLVEKVYCGHTYFDLPQKLLNSLLKDDPQFPLPLIFLNKKAYLDHAKTEIPLGAEITAINGIPMEDVMVKLLPQVRSDGYNATMKYHMLADDFALRHFLSFGRKETFRVDYLPFGSDETIQTQIPAILGKKLEGRMVQRHSRTGKFKKYKLGAIEKGISLLSMNTFDFGLNKKGRQKYKGFLRDNFKELEENDGAQCIILDLRQNDGGYVGNDAQLFAYFAQAPFRDFRSAETMTMKIPIKEHLARDQFPKMLEKIFGKEFKAVESGRFSMIDEKNRRWNPKKTAFDGQVYVLISGWTHSGGTVLCSYLLNNDNVIFIGEETGGGHDTFTAGNMVLYNLPNTRCQLEVPLILYENYRGEKAFPKGHGIQPHHKVTQSQKDLIANIDTVMEFALQLARKSTIRKTPPGK